VFIFIFGLLGFAAYLVTNRPPRDVGMLDIFLSFVVVGIIGAVVGALSERL
jgi:uncharacterized membrane protein YeaQ/YmgE (transglycosylase-associated protein family)